MYIEYTPYITPTPTPTATTATPTPTPTITPYPAGNISISAYSSDYIVFCVNNRNVSELWVDGNNVEINASCYVLSGISPSTYHSACIAGGECVSMTTPMDGVSVLLYWIPFILLIVLASVSYFIPLTLAPVTIYSIYLITIYLPQKNAIFELYILTVVLLCIGIVCSIRGWNR